MTELQELKNLIAMSYGNIDCLMINFWDTEARAYLIDAARTRLQNALNALNILEQKMT